MIDEEYHKWLEQDHARLLQENADLRTQLEIALNQLEYVE